jgi:ankyrin repeat protein
MTDEDMTDEEMSELGQIANLPSLIDKACEKDDLEKLKKLISQGVTNNILNNKRINGDTPLLISYKLENYRCFKFLLEHPLIDVNVKDRQGYALLHLACRDRKFEIIELLLNHPNINVNIQDGDNKQTPFNRACITGDIKVLEYLIPYSNINIQDVNGNTSLHYACQNEKIEVVKLLLSRPDIDINTINTQRETSLFMACNYSNNSELVKLLLDYPNIDVNLYNNWGRSPIHIVCHNQNLSNSVFKLLVKMSSSIINKKDNWNKTPLHIVCKDSVNLDYISILLENPEIKDSFATSGVTDTIKSYRLLYKLSLPVIVLLNNKFKKVITLKINNILDSILD